jgi:hypothetical protein
LRDARGPVFAEIATVAARAEKYPSNDAQQPRRSTTLTIDCARPVLGRQARQAAAGAAAVLMAAFGVILIACANSREFPARARCVADPGEEESDEKRDRLIAALTAQF